MVRLRCLDSVLIVCGVLGLLRGSAFAATPITADTVRVAIVNANYRAALEEIVTRYEELHPDIHVELTIVGTGFETWIRSRVAAGGDMMPDIYNANFTSGFERLGRWVALDDYYDAINPYTGKPWRDGLDMSMTERYRYGGHYYQVVLDTIEGAFFCNTRIFEELGLTVPRTWDELLVVCTAIREGGYIPIATSGDAESFWLLGMGWFVRMMGDAYLRDCTPAIMSRPGDWDYDATRNANYAYDGADPYSDMLVVCNTERMFNAIREGRMDFRSPKFKQVYRRLKQLAAHFQEGYMGSDFGNAMALFYRQKAAMSYLLSDRVTGMVYDFEKMSPEDRFEFGIFWPPPITDDPLVCGPFRGIGGGGVCLAVTQTDDRDHEQNVMDFLMYLTSPESGRVLVEKTLEARQPLIGPLLIRDVDLPGGLDRKFAPFLGHGFEKINFRGLNDEQESVSEWTVIAQEYMADRLSLDDFCDQYHDIMLRAIERLARRDGLDFDPTTKDEPPPAATPSSRWNPFENGLLMLGGIVILYGCYASVNITRSRGPARARARVAYALLVPTFLLLAAFNYYPAFSGLYHAFTEWESGREPVFCGLANFRRLLHDRMFFRGVGNMSILLVTALLKATLVPFLAAEMIRYLSSARLQYWFRTAFILPMVVPAMVGILLWRFIYEPNMGLLNQTLTSLGFEKLTANWLGNPDLALGSLVFMGFPWVGAFGLLIYLAGLSHIPTSIYEAYRLESEHLWRRILHIDIPLLRGQTRLLLILTFIGALQDFQTILIMTRGGPGMSTYVPALRMYHQAFTYGHFGYGAAIGLVIFLAVLAATIVNLRVLKPAEELGA